MRKVDGRKLQFITMVGQITAVFENLLLWNTDTLDYSVMPSCQFLNLPFCKARLNLGSLTEFRQPHGTSQGRFQPKVEEGGSICRVGAKNILRGKRAEIFGPLFRKTYLVFN